MRSETDLLVEFKRGDDNTPSYWRERVLLEVLLDLRGLLSNVLKTVTKP